MSHGISQPVNQKRHTNVSVVSVKRVCPEKGRLLKFEIACYKNKVGNLRQGTEVDLSQVLQSQSVFTDVGRGKLAAARDLQSVFNTSDQLEICKIILNEGLAQVNEKERSHFSESRWNEVVQRTAQDLVDSASGYGVTSQQVDSALHSLGFKLDVHKGKKESEDLKLSVRDACKLLCSKLPEVFSRANMLIQVEDVGQLGEVLGEGMYEVVEGGVLCHPSSLRLLQDRGVKVTVVSNKVIGTAPVGVRCKAEDEQQREGELALSAPVTITPPPKAPALGSNVCRTCLNEQFDSVSDFRAHCRSEWHTFNKKRAHRGLGAVDHLEFEVLPRDLRDGFLAVE
jgi:ribosome maturation protein SDO1